MVWGNVQTADANTVRSFVSQWYSKLISNDANFKSLHVMSMRKLSEAELVALYEALAKNTNLLELSTSGHFHSLKAYQALSDAIAIHPNLNHLSCGIAGDASGDAVSQLLFSACVRNKRAGGCLSFIDLENKTLDASIAASLGSLLVECQGLTVQLARNNFGDEGCKQLYESSVSLSPGYLSASCSLDLTDNSIGPFGLFYLSQWIMQSTCTVHRLVLHGNVIGAKGLQHLASGISSSPLKIIELSKIASSSDSALDLDEALVSFFENASMSRLQEVKMTHVRSTGNEMNSHFAQRMARALSKIPNLSRLSIRHSYLGNEFAESFANCLQQPLELLDLADNLISTSMGKLVSASCTLVRHLILFDNKWVQSYEWNDAPVSPILSRLDLGHCEMNQEPLKPLVQYLSEHVPSITLVELAANNLPFEWESEPSLMYEFLGSLRSTLQLDLSKRA